MQYFALEVTDESQSLYVYTVYYPGWSERGDVVNIKAIALTLKEIRDS